MKPIVEQLEARTLFAGVTLTATGRLGPNSDWQTTMVNEITARLGGPAQVPEYVLQVNQDQTTGALVSNIFHVNGTGTPQTSSSGEIEVVIDYYNISANASFNGDYIGQVVANALMTTPVDGILLAQLPIHGVGVSRGSAIIDGTAKALGQAGIWMDQETYLDPNPIAAQGDPPTTIYDNVEFVDDYWRNDGSASQINDGHPVNGAYNLNVYWLDANSSGYGTPHLAPTGYYNGTIDLNATFGGDGPIYNSWYGNTPTMPARDATGFIYTSLVGAARPLSGVWAASGGSGVRTATVQQGSQWGMLADLALASGNTISSGDPLTATYIHQDRDSADTVTFFLDTDRNPYNGNAATLSTVTLAQATAIAQGQSTLSTAGVAPGAYWLGAKVTDAQGNTRYDYSPVDAQLHVQARNGPSAALAASTVTTRGASGQQFTVTYTDSANVAAATLGDSNLTVTGANGYTQAATLVSTGLTDSPTLTATYSISAPNGGWTYPDNGLYTVSLAGGQVADVFGGVSQAQQVGTFLVAVPGAGSVVATIDQSTVPAGLGQVSTPLAGREVFLDVNGSGVAAGNPSGITDANGQVTFSNVVVGSYALGVVLPAGWVQSTPPGGVSVSREGQIVNPPPIGEYELPATVTGQVFDDLNYNSLQDSGEPGLAGAVLYVDLNGTGKYQAGDPTATTDAGGNYQFTGLSAARPVTIAEVLAPGYVPTTATSATLTLSPGQTSSASPFGQFQLPATLTGHTFDDLNGNGVPDSGELGLPGVVVYLDLNGSGQYQPGDPTATSDSNGNYQFTGLTAGGSVSVREVLPTGRRETGAASDIVTLTAGQTATAAPFGSTTSALIAGSLVLSTSSNSVGAGSLSGFEVILTQHRKHGKTTKLVTFTAADGSYSFANLEPNATDTIQVIKRKGFKATSHARTTFQVKVTYAGQVVSGLNFSQTPILTPARLRKGSGA